MAKMRVERTKLKGHTLLRPSLRSLCKPFCESDYSLERVTLGWVQNVLRLLCQARGIKVASTKRSTRIAKCIRLVAIVVFDAIVASIVRSKLIGHVITAINCKVLAQSLSGVLAIFALLLRPCKLSFRL